MGANTGANPNDPIFSLVVKNRWRGVLVEPVPATYAQLMKNYKATGLPGISFERAAISTPENAAKGYIEFCVPREFHMHESDGTQEFHSSHLQVQSCYNSISQSSFRTYL